MRKFIVVVGLAILAWIFLVPSCSSKFGCAAGRGVAHALDNACPSDLEAAANDRAWAAARLATIKDKKETVGLLYDEDGNELELTSAKDSLQACPGGHQGPRWTPTLGREPRGGQGRRNHA